MDNIKKVKTMTAEEFKKFAQNNNIDFYATKQDAIDNKNILSINFDYFGDNGDLYIEDGKVYEKQSSGDVPLAYISLCKRLVDRKPKTYNSYHNNVVTKSNSSLLHQDDVENGKSSYFTDYHDKVVNFVIKSLINDIEKESGIGKANNHKLSIGDLKKDDYEKMEKANNIKPIYKGMTIEEYAKLKNYEIPQKKSELIDAIKKDSDKFDNGKIWEIKGLDYDFLYHQRDYVCILKDDKIVGLIYKKNNIYVNLDGSSDTTYKRYDLETHQLKNISIFDKENTFDKQYGASQCSFYNDFSKLIKDDFIWNEMQKRYPVEAFDSLSDAMEFYENYFGFIAETGCGYAAAANIIYKQFEGKEKEFENTFGFPMYEISKEGTINFNYEKMELLYFNYHAPSIHDSIIKYIKDPFTYTNLKDVDLDSVANFLENYGIDATSTKDYHNITTRFVNDDIVNDNLKNECNVNDYIIYGGIGYDLYDEFGDLYHSSSEDNAGHYMMITGFNDDGKPIVSSWGRKFILDIKGEYNGLFDLYRYWRVNFKENNNI